MVVSDEKSKIVVRSSLKARLVGELFNGFCVVAWATGRYVLFEGDGWEVVDTANYLN